MGSDVTLAAMVVSSSACECFLGTVAHLLIRLAVEPLGCIDFFFFFKDEGFGLFEHLFRCHGRCKPGECVLSVGEAHLRPCAGSWLRRRDEWLPDDPPGHSGRL